MTRSICALFFAAAAFIVAAAALVTAAIGCGAPLPVAGTLALAGGAAAAWLAARWRAVDDVAALRPGILGVGAIGTSVALVQLARLTVFMIDPAQAAWSVQPGNQFRIHHSCVSAYWVACQEVDDVADVYRLQRYEPPRDAAGRRQRVLIDGFVLDAYEYPPPFLMLPRLLAHAAPTFLRFRSLSFAIQLVAVVAGIVVIARRMGGGAGAAALALGAVILIPTPVMGTLQIGNAQLAFIAIAMIAMVLFERRHPAAGGLLLAYATVSKLYPALLVVYLLLRRDWRNAGWTIRLGMALLAMSLADVGWTPYVAFAHHLPRLLSGEAFPAMMLPEGMSLNESVPGLPIKLLLFGLAPATLAWARVAGWLYTPVLLWATFRFARTAFARSDEPLAWLAVLLLATYRSTFLPAYAVFPALWLLVLLAGRYRQRPLALGLLAATWLLLMPTLAGIPELFVVSGVLTTLQTLAGLVLAVVVLRIPSTEHAPVGAVAAAAPPPSTVPA